MENKKSLIALALVALVGVVGATFAYFTSSATLSNELEEGTDIECTTSIADEKTTSSCESLTSGYAGVTYSLDITIETIQADKKWSYEIPTIISFSVNGVEYQAEAGMTWKDWVESDYNVDEFYVSSANVVCRDVDNTTRWIGNSSNLIVANTNYKFSSSPLPI